MMKGLINGHWSIAVLHHPTLHALLEYFIYFARILYTLNTLYILYSYFAGGLQSTQPVV